MNGTSGKNKTDQLTCAETREPGYHTADETYGELDSKDDDDINDNNDDRVLTDLAK